MIFWFVFVAWLVVFVVDIMGWMVNPAIYFPLTIVTGAYFGLHIARPDQAPPEQNKPEVNPHYDEAMRELDELDGGIDRRM